MTGVKVLEPKKLFWTIVVTAEKMVDLAYVGIDLDKYLKYLTPKKPQLFHDLHLSGN